MKRPALCGLWALGGALGSRAVLAIELRGPYAGIVGTPTHADLRIAQGISWTRVSL
jgi:hypothetical protein